MVGGGNYCDLLFGFLNKKSFWKGSYSKKVKNLLPIGGWPGSTLLSKACLSDYLGYGKCPKISYTKVSDKWNICKQGRPRSDCSWSDSTLFAIPTIIFKNNCIKSKI